MKMGTSLASSRVDAMEVAMAMAAENEWTAAVASDMAGRPGVGQTRFWNQYIPTYETSTT